MAISSTIQLRGYISGLLAGSRSISPTDQTNADAPNQVTQVTLASGDNTITVPTKARGCIINFASTSTTTKTLKGAAGDTGIVLDRTGWNVLKFYSTPPASFIINSSAADTGLLTEITFF